MVTDADFDELKESFDRYKKVVDTLLVNLLQPALDVPGTLRTGGNLQDIGTQGIQVKSGSGGTNMVYFVPSLSPDPNGQDIKSRIQGTNSATIATLTAASSITSLGLQGSVFTYASDQANDVAGIRLDPLTPDIVQNTNVDLYAQRSNSFGNMVLTNIVFRLASFTSDPASLADGDMWYRSDTDVIRYRANGATVSIGSGILTDTAWAAKGDLAVGTGNDTAQILSKGTDGTRLVADATGIATYGIGWKAFWYIVASCTGSGTTALSSYHKYVRFASMTGNCTATLYSAAAIGEGDCVLFKRNDTTGFNATINTTSSQTIDGALSITLAPYESALLVSNGSNWERN